MTDLNESTAISADTRPSSGGTARPTRVAAVQQMLESVIRVGREMLGRARGQSAADGAPAEWLVERCRTLLHHQGEASGLALADEILAAYHELSPGDRLAFLTRLADEFGPDRDAILVAANAYMASQDFETLAALSKAIEAPRLKLFRRLNGAPGATRRIVAMRADVLSALESTPQLRPLDADLGHLLKTWFNRGFLALARLDWRSSAELLEKVVAYEAVHEVRGLEDLRTRLAPDRRCFAFFHPAVPDDPLIFVQVALTRGMPGSISPLLASERDVTDPFTADTAVFYSITNCHKGLKGISFGNFLIKQVVDELRGEFENIKDFVTLSPIPGFRKWVRHAPEGAVPDYVQEDLRLAKDLDRDSSRLDGPTTDEDLESPLTRLCAHYLLEQRCGAKPADAVARFHLSNGAGLERLNWNGDPSPAGRDRSFGIMVNYVYRPKEIERNHEIYSSEASIAASPAVRRLLRA